MKLTQLAGKTQIVVEIADFKVSADRSAVLVTYALGSCVAVVVHDPVRKVGGMIHYMLPVSRINPKEAERRPAMFADTGIPLLFEAMYALGCKKADLVVKITGAGKIYEDHGTFQIGTRNYDVARKLLTHNRVRISREDVGGAKSRTPRLFVETGRLVISSLGKEAEL